MVRTGTLYLIPVPLGAAPVAASLPPEVCARIRALEHFIVEDPKRARAHLKAIGLSRPLQSIRMQTLNEHTPPQAVPGLLEPLRSGHDTGLLSDAGCPAVADPGATLVAAAHRFGIRVVPLVGPSSILLALMASGLDGQRFAFRGYLPAESRERVSMLQTLEQESALRRETQVFIETPYRNARLLDDLLAHGRPDTRLCIASQLTLPDEQIRTATLAEWRAQPTALPREPAVFLLLAAT